MSIVKNTEYQGKPMLTIMKSEEDKYPFSFGLMKAMLILEHLDAIKEFVEKNKK